MSESAALPSIEQIIANTAFKTEKRAKAAQETLKWLEDGAPHKFDGLPGKYFFQMNRFVKPHGCGTACCIAGAMLQFEESGLSRHQERVGYDLDGEFLRPLNLDKERRNLRELFFAFDGALVLEEIKPSLAAAVLRQYLTTGIVDWSIDVAGAR